MNNAVATQEYDFGTIVVRITCVPCEERDHQARAFEAGVIHRTDSLVALILLDLDVRDLTPRMIVFVREKARMQAQALARELGVLGKAVVATEHAGKFDEYTHEEWKAVLCEAHLRLAEIPKRLPVECDLDTDGRFVFTVAFDARS